MKTVIRVTVSVWLLTAPVSAQHWHDEREHWQKYDKHLDDERDREFDSHLQGCFFQPADVHIVSAYYAPRYRLRELQRRVLVVLDLHDRSPGIDHAVVQDGAHLDGDVVARDDILRRHLEDHGAQPDAHHPVDRRKHEDDAGALWTRQTSPSLPEEFLHERAALFLEHTRDHRKSMIQPGQLAAGDRGRDRS